MKRRVLLGSAVVLTGVVAVACLWLSADLDALPPTSHASQVLSVSTARVRDWSATLVDETRQTPARREVAALSSRTLKVHAWFNADAKHAPLVIYSHGFGGNRDDLTYATELLAARGAVVVALDFPSTNTYAKGGPWLDDVVNQPGDVRFVVDQLLAFNRDAQHPLFGRIDEARIGAMGLSLGGMTTQLLVFDPLRRDERIRAAVSIAGLRSMLTPSFYAARGVPFLEIGATDDNVVRFADNAARVPRDIPGSRLVALSHGTHAAFAGVFRYLRFIARPDDIACRFIKQNTATGAAPRKWSELLGEAPGLVDDTPAHLCEPQGETQLMDPREQHRLTALAVASFFDSVFSPDEATRREAAEYLNAGLAKEFPGEVTLTLGVTDGAP